VIGGVAKKDAQSGPWGEFVWCGGSKVGIARAAKDPKLMVGGKSTIESKMRSGHVEGLGGETIEEESSSGEGVSPIRGGHGRLKEESANDVVGGAENTFSLAVLLRGVWARHAQDDTLGKEESAGGGVIKLTTIITLNCLNSAAELSENVGEKIRETGKSLRFETKRKRP
jgi:hypothetical protein